MSWIDKFSIWKEQGKTTEWLNARVDVLYSNGYINQVEYDEIKALINS